MMNVKQKTCEYQLLKSWPDSARESNPGPSVSHAFGLDSANNDVSVGEQLLIKMRLCTKKLSNAMS